MSDTTEDDEPEDPAPVETIDLTDPVKYRRSQDKAKREGQENDSFWRAVMADKTGRREMWRLVAVEGKAFNTDFACGPTGFPQPEATWHNLGRQQWAMRLYHNLLRIDPEGVRRMHDECDDRFIVVKPERRRPPE